MFVEDPQRGLLLANADEFLSPLENILRASCEGGMVC